MFYLLSLRATPHAHHARLPVSSLALVYALFRAPALLPYSFAQPKMVLPGS